jgi:hypothetical protein
MLFVVLDCVLPAVHGPARREQVDARRETPVDQHIGKALGCRAIRQVGENKQRFHARRVHRVF